MMTTTKREPNQREKMGPYFSDRLSRERWSGGLIRWRLPIMGSVGGCGGRFFSLLCKRNLNVKVEARKRSA